MYCVKIVGALLALVGVTELTTQAKFNKSSVDIVREISAGLIYKFKKHLHRTADIAEIDDEVRHRRWWGYKDEEHQDDHVKPFHEAMREKMVAVKVCHRMCGGSHACHKKCPKPWKPFQEKCEKLQPIWSCHMECRLQRGGHACHAQCPLPECPKLARKMRETMQCHHKCGPGSRECHHACPRPLAQINKKCDALKEVTACHEKCQHGDHACHHSCPKMWGLLRHGGHRDGSAAEDQARHQRWWGYRDEEHQSDHRWNFHKFVKGNMVKVKDCHRACGNDHACHRACPKPWGLFQDKCDKFQPVWTCHKECRRNRGGHACHAQCPLPDCPKLASKMQAAMQCHQQCGSGDCSCHRACPHPMAHIKQRCHMLHEVEACHEECEPGDQACHHACPKMLALWRQGTRDGQKLVLV